MKKKDIMNLMGFRPVEYPGVEAGIYEITCDGRARRKVKDGTYKDMKQEDTGHALRVTLRMKDGSHRKVRVHELVVRTWTCEDLEGKEIHHINSDYKDNSVQNLMVVTHAEHMRIEADLATAGKKERRYTTDVAQHVIDGAWHDETVSALGREHNLHTKTVKKILHTDTRYGIERAYNAAFDDLEAESDAFREYVCHTPSKDLVSLAKIATAVVEKAYFDAKTKTPAGEWLKGKTVMRDAIVDTVKRAKREGYDTVLKGYTWVESMSKLVDKALVV